MALVSASIPNLINGVSQQPPSLRLKTQAEIQENGFSTVVDGLKKRPSSEHIKTLSNVPSNIENAYNSTCMLQIKKHSPTLPFALVFSIPLERAQMITNSSD